MSPSSILNPQAAAFAPSPMSQSTLNPQAATFVPTPFYTQVPVLNPLAATFIPHPRYDYSILNLQALAFIPACNTALISSEEPAVEAVTTAEPFTFDNDMSSFKVRITTDVEMEEAPAFEEPTPSPLDEETVTNPETLTSDMKPSAEEYLYSHDNNSFCRNTSTTDDFEYKQQEMQMYQNPEVHHFNFMGQGVMHKTSTPSAVFPGCRTFASQSSNG